MNNVEKSKLWEEYGKTKSPEIREKIILEYAPLVKIVAGRLSMYLGYKVEYEDLTSYGIFGLIDAIDKFDPSKAVKFETYASLRIRGSILDQIRKMDWIPRTLRQRQKKVEEAIKEIELEDGHIATDEEVAERLDITPEEYSNWQSQMKVTNVVSLNEFMETGAEPVKDTTGQEKFTTPEASVEKEELKEQIKEALENLTEKEKKVIILYYYEELTLKEISHILGVTESRVSQLHTKGLQKMRRRLGDYCDILTSS